MPLDWSSSSRTVMRDFSGSERHSVITSETRSSSENKPAPAPAMPSAPAKLFVPLAIRCGRSAFQPDVYIVVTSRPARCTTSTSEPRRRAYAAAAA